MASSGKRARLKPPSSGRGKGVEEEGYEINYTPHYEVLVKEGQ